ncbi:MAG: glycerol kinase [Chloroflexi bacterium HGW-Chloroflexi-5]|jgi:glycerol kinase|nr:MAG: glycerol kinase [Chloroflexi bacterium HGW-Chloroflexi-5]
MVNSAGLFLAIDQSTSATKALLFSQEGCLVDQETCSHQQIYPKPGWVEHNAEEIFQNTLKATTALLSRHNEKWNNLLALSITNQRETFVIFDKETGHPLCNAIVWQCRRGAAICNQLVSAGKEDLVHDLTGLKIDTYFPASKLSWLLHSRPDLRDRLKDGSALFGTIDTYLIYRLTNCKVYATDHTNASRTLFYDIEKLAWSQELCDVFGVDFFLLPEVRESKAWFGDTDLVGFLNTRIPIYGVMGDSQAALFAQRCFEPGSAKVTFGTGSSILLNIGHEKRLSDSGTVTALAWVMDGAPTYAFEGIINFTGATITWLRDQMQLIDNVTETEKIALSVPDSDGVYFIPAFVGLSAPYWRSDVKAAILGLTPSTTKAHIVRAALESIGYIVTDVINAMSKDSGVELKTVHGDGGAVSNSFLMQFISDLNQNTLLASQLPELSALGAVYSGALGLKIFATQSELAFLPAEYTKFTPKQDVKTIDGLLENWHLAVHQILNQTKEG